MLGLLWALGCESGRTPIVLGDNPDGGDLGGSCENTIVGVPLEQRRHIPEGTTPQYLHNPPVSGEHYGEAWARWQIHTSEVARGYWVHNLEHGGVVFLYRKGAPDGVDAPPSVVSALATAYNRASIDSSPECQNVRPPHKRIVVTPDHLLPADLVWAAVASGPEDASGGGIGYMVEGSCVNVVFLRDFAETHRAVAAGEMNCEQGAQ